jgi:dipeptidase E
VRLYLSSFGTGAHLQRLVGLVGAGRRAALIPNALDHAHDVGRRAAGLQREVEDLTALGFTTTEVDLREDGAVDRLATGFDLVWVPGGNVFVLRRALADSAADAAIVDLLTRDALVYGGYSAGACVLAPDLHGLEAVDDPDEAQSPIWTGLGVLDRPFVPHVRSPGHPETKACDDVARSYALQGRAHWAVRDGEVLVVEGHAVRLLPRGCHPA